MITATVCMRCLAVMGIHLGMQAYSTLVKADAACVAIIWKGRCVWGEVGGSLVCLFHGEQSVRWSHTAFAPCAFPLQTT